MRWSFSDFLSTAFPDLGRPRYQSTLERLGFILVTSSLVGILLTSLALVIYEL
jgi:hypothetical protein